MLLIEGENFFTLIYTNLIYTNLFNKENERI